MVNNRATSAAELAQDEPLGDLELVMTFDGPMPTGVSVSHTGRIFVNFPRWDDPTAFTVAELRAGQLVPGQPAGR